MGTKLGWVGRLGTRYIQWAVKEELPLDVSTCFVGAVAKEGKARIADLQN